MFKKLKILILTLRVHKRLKKHGGMRICSKEQIQDLAVLIVHKATYALYELHTELKGGMSWLEFAKFVQNNGTISRKIQSVAGRTVVGFDASQLDFELPLEWHEDHPDKDLLYTPAVISEVAAQGMVEALFLKCEAEHFQRLAATAKGYTWDAYMRDLTNNKELWGKLTRGLQHGLYQMDFKSSWKDKATPDQILALDFDSTVG